MINDLYIIGDQSRLVVKNIINQFTETYCNIKTYAPDPDEINYLPKFSIYLLILLSDNIDFKIIRTIAEFQKKYDYLVCFIGHINNLSLQDDQFFKQIPSIKVQSYTINTDKLLELMEKNDHRKKHILVVDDEPILLRSMRVWLGEDFNLSLVNSGEMAIEFLDKHPVDLVLLDYKMPTMTGPQVLEIIRKNPRLTNLPVIFLTANNDRQSVINAMQYKPEGYILKNKTPYEIRETVKDFFKNRVIKI